MFKQLVVGARGKAVGKALTIMGKENKKLEQISNDLHAGKLIFYFLQK